MRKNLFLVGAIFCCGVMPMSAHAQGAAPEMFGVKEVVIQYVHFDDPAAADTCGLTREDVQAALVKALANTGVPAVTVADAKPPTVGSARIQLIPEIYTHAGENLDCVSWISLSAESRANTVISPVATLRSITAVYWRQHAKVATGQSLHQNKVDEILDKMAVQFAQQYRVDQPPDIITK